MPSRYQKGRFLGKVGFLPFYIGKCKSREVQGGFAKCYEVQDLETKETFAANASEILLPRIEHCNVHSRNAKTALDTVQGQDSLQVLRDQTTSICKAEAREYTAETKHIGNFATKTANSMILTD